MAPPSRSTSTTSRAASVAFVCRAVQPVHQRMSVTVPGPKARSHRRSSDADALVVVEPRERRPEPQIGRRPSVLARQPRPAGATTHDASVGRQQEQDPGRDADLRAPCLPLTERELLPEVGNGRRELRGRGLPALVQRRHRGALDPAEPPRAVARDPLLLEHRDQPAALWRARAPWCTPRPSRPPRRPVPRTSCVASRASARASAVRRGRPRGRRAGTRPRAPTRRGRRWRGRSHATRPSGSRPPRPNRTARRDRGGSPGALGAARHRSPAQGHAIESLRARGTSQEGRSALLSRSRVSSGWSVRIDRPRTLRNERRIARPSPSPRPRLTCPNRWRSASTARSQVPPLPRRWRVTEVMVNGLTMTSGARGRIETGAGVGLVQPAMRRHRKANNTGQLESVSVPRRRGCGDRAAHRRPRAR